MNILKSITFLVVGGLLLSGTPVVADEVIIIYRSGKIQTLQIDGTTDPVEQVSFRRRTEEPAQNRQQPQPPVESAVSAPKPAAAAAPAPAKKDAPTKAQDRSGVRIKWAEPVDARY